MPLDEARIICLFLECYHTRHAAFSGYDAIFVKLGANLIIEETSLDLVRGSTIDVVEEIISNEMISEMISFILPGRQQPGLSQTVAAARHSRRRCNRSDNGRETSLLSL